MFFFGKINYAKQLRNKLNLIQNGDDVCIKYKYRDGRIEEITGSKGRNSSGFRLLTQGDNDYKEYSYDNIIELVSWKAST